MKSTYLLLGKYWDHKKRSDFVLENSTIPDTVFSIESPPTLFDSAVSARSIDASNILDAMSDEDFTRRLSGISNCENLIIRYDFARNEEAIILNNFIDDRLGRAVASIHEIAPRVDIRVIITHPAPHAKI